MEKELIKNLKIILANTFALYLKTHFFHWNVTGSDFPQLHKLFEEQYTELWESVDAIAEKIRYLDAYAPGSFERFQELNEIESTTTVPPAREMLIILKNNHTVMIDLLNTAFDAADQVKDQAIMNFIAERLDAHKKYHWMLTATARQ